MAITLPSNIRVGIIDLTSIDPLKPAAVRMVAEGISAGVTAAGLAHFQITAAVGGGHKSHAQGTEIDGIGFNADGSRWSQDQRVTVAIYAARAGADRFGLYSDAGGSYRGNAIHLGTGEPGGVTWGFEQRTSGEASRAFTHPAEKAFALAVKEGRAAQLTPPVGRPPARVPPLPRPAPQPVPTKPRREGWLWDLLRAFGVNV